MSERAFDWIAEAYLADGPTILPDRVLDAALDEVHLTRQRRAGFRGPWRFPIMNTYAKLAVVAVVVIAVGAIGLAVLRPGDSSGVGVSPPVSPSPSAAPTDSPAPSVSPTPTASAIPTAPPLTGQFTSDRHGFSIAVPDTWLTRDAATPWTSGFVDYAQENGDILYESLNPGNIWVAVASQPLGDRTRAAWEADVWQSLIDDDPGATDCASSSEPVTIDGAPGVICGTVALVTDGGRGYYILLYVSDDDPRDDLVYDREWFDSVLASIELHPEDAIDEVASPSPS